MIRASSMPLAIKCPVSQFIDANTLKIVSDPDITSAGLAVHKALQCFFSGVDCKLEDIAVAYGADLEDLRHLYWAGRRIWENLVDRIDVGQVYHEINMISPDFSGHADRLIVSSDGETAWVIDYKSGYKDSDYRQQLLTYAHLSLHNFPTVKQVYSCIFWLRTGEYEGEWVTREANNLWYAEALKRLEEFGFNPGRHCTYCQRFLECPAAKSQLIQAGEVLIESAQQTELTEVDKFFTILDAQKMLSDYCEKVHTMLRAQLAAVGGKIESEDREVFFVEQSRREIDAKVALPIIREKFGSDTADQCCSVSKKSIEEVVKASVGRGQKGKAAAAFLAELEERGAVTINKTLRMNDKRKVAQPLLKGD